MDDNNHYVSIRLPDEDDYRWSGPCVLCKKTNDSKIVFITIMSDGHDLTDFCLDCWRAMTAEIERAIDAEVD